MKVRILKDFEVVPGRTLPEGTICEMWDDYARRAVNIGAAIDLEGKYVRFELLDGAVIEKRKKTITKKK